QLVPDTLPEQQPEWRIVRSLFMASLRRWRQSLSEVRSRRREAREREILANRAEAQLRLMTLESARRASESEARLHLYRRVSVWSAAALGAALVSMATIALTIAIRAEEQEVAAKNALDNLFAARARAIWSDLPRSTYLDVRGKNALWQ